MPRGTMRSLLTPLHLPDGSAPGGGPLFHQVPIEGGTPDRIELSEAECDIDTIKKLKLGMRSSLWSRPNASNSTAVGATGGPNGNGTGTGSNNNNNNGGGGGINNNNNNNNGNSGIVGSIMSGTGGGNATGHPSDYSIAV
uniref:Uncharacterized protein n=2 Tax=Anopheles stephensi TaxID=30069 RepID=A0A182YQB0_ANOST